MFDIGIAKCTTRRVQRGFDRGWGVGLNIKSCKFSEIFRMIFVVYLPTTCCYFIVLEVVITNSQYN